MSLTFSVASCVRVSSKASTCAKCIDICPVETISLSANLPSFTPSECINCGGCVGSCPSEAFGLSDFNVINFLFEQFGKNEILSCKTNLPCLSILGVEELMSLVMGSKALPILDLAHCSGCEISSKLYPQILANIEEANFILSSFTSKRILTQECKVETVSKEIKSETQTDRRAFLENFKLKNALKRKIDFDNEVSSTELKTFELDSMSIAHVKNKKIPLRRKLLFTLFKREPQPLKYETLDSENISFISQKYIDVGCDNCQMCYRVCPTGALNATSNLSTINFDSMLCVKCHLCHDVCEKNVLKLQPTFEIQEFFEPKKRALVHFSIKRCGECGNQFSYFGGEAICPRCQVEEEESAFLHSNAKVMESKRKEFKNATS